MSAANKFKGLFSKKQEKPIKSVDSVADKQKVEILRKQILEKLKRDPEGAKKAALIIEKMINSKTPKKR